ncbi:hypothetical protein LXL04_035236 [Taraxacum kok-saghyz]
MADPYLKCLEDHETREVLNDLHEGDCGYHTGGILPYWLADMEGVLPPRSWIAIYLKILANGKGSSLEMNISKFRSDPDPDPNRFRDVTPRSDPAKIRTGSRSGEKKNFGEKPSESEPVKLELSHLNQNQIPVAGRG